MSMEIVVFVVLAVAAMASGWLVFRVDSMARATFSLLGSFLAVACLMLLLASEFLFAITFLMMIGEMVIMVLYMIAFMMNPAGLNPMNMVHQPRWAAAAGIVTFLVLASAILVTDWPVSEAGPPEDVTAAIGHELLGDSMLIFETAGVTLLTGMIAVMAMAARRGRFGDAIVVEREDGDGGGHDHGGHH